MSRFAAFVSQTLSPGAAVLPPTVSFQYQHNYGLHVPSTLQRIINLRLLLIENKTYWFYESLWHCLVNLYQVYQHSII